MSRTRRDNFPYVVNLEDWASPWKATGDHGNHFFSSGAKIYIKMKSKRRSRAAQRIIIHNIIENIEFADNAVFPNEKQLGDPWDIDWFRD